MVDQDRDDEHTEAVDQDVVRHGYEYQDVPGKRIFIVLGALVLSALLSVLGATGFLIWLADDGSLMNPPPRQAVIPPEPRLQVSPPRDLEQLRAHEDARLNGYAWADPEAGTVRIPVVRAMELLASHNVRLNTSADVPPTWMISAQPAFEQQTNTVTDTTTSAPGTYSTPDYSAPDTGYASPGPSFGTDFAYPQGYQP